MDQTSGVVLQSHSQEGAVESLHTPHGDEPPPDDMEWPSEATLHSHQAGYEAAKWGGTGKSYKRARSTLLETLKIHRLEEEYYYILGGEKGPPLNKLEMVPMEVCGEGETTVSQGGGDAPLGHKQAFWEEQVQAEEEWRPKDNPRKKLPLPPLRNTMSAATTMPPVAPSTSDDGFIMVQGRKSRDKRPRDPSKDPTPPRRPSKASRSPLPFPLKSESERVANVHTIFEAAISQNRPRDPSKDPTPPRSHPAPVERMGWGHLPHPSS